MVFKENLPRLVIGAPRGQSGKTTITLGLLSALKQKGFKVQPFKKGPDYIDAGWMTAVSQRTCRNLDCFLLDEEDLLKTFVDGSMGADISIVEGAMGFYDGLDQEGSGSTAQIAKILKAPVVLVIDCKRATRSIAATVLGFQNFDPKVKIVGVILNNVATTRQKKMIKNCIREYCNLPVLGVVPKNEKISLPSRHLGLIPTGENPKLNKTIEFLRQIILDSLDIEGLLQLARKAIPLNLIGVSKTYPEVHGLRPRIGIIRDKVFSFYYPENLEALEKASAELVFIDSLNQQELPSLDGLFIGGGFPEVFSKELSQNKKFMESVKRQVEAGLPTYAECGGMLYLGRSLILNEKRFPMVGVLPFDGLLEVKPLGHGYTVMEALEANPLVASGEFVKGHEFHNTRLVNLDRSNLKWAYRVHRGYGIDGKKDGLVHGNVLASYNHLHALGAKNWAKNFVDLAKKYRASKISDKS